MRSASPVGLKKVLRAKWNTLLDFGLPNKAANTRCRQNIADGGSMSRSEQTRGETKTRFERVSKAIDQLIEVATYEQESAVVSGTSEKFKSAFEELRDLRADGKSSDPVIQAIRAMIAMVDTRGF
jgi:hypothetical protein